MESYISVKEVKKSFGSGQGYNLVLKGITLEIAKSNFCVILGPSGCGKSTFINILGGIDSPDSGDVIINQQNIASFDQKELASYRRENIGFVFQFYNLIPDLTIKENVRVCENLTDKPLDINELFETLGLRELEQRFPHELSGGQQQRSAIARALIKNPRVLFCDEPTGALDSKTSKEILRLLSDVNKKYGSTIIMVTHNENIAKLANQIITMKDGQILQNKINKDIRNIDEIEL